MGEVADRTLTAWTTLLDASGGRYSLAVLLRVRESTVYRWSVGESTPHALMQEKLNAICDDYKIARVYEGSASDAAPKP